MVLIYTISLINSHVSLTLNIDVFTHRPDRQKVVYIINNTTHDEAFRYRGKLECTATIKFTVN